MKITAVRSFALRGATPDGGWAQGYDPDEDLHTLVAVDTDSGIRGWGSVFTSGSLVESSLRLLRPYLLGEDVEPERLSEKLLQSTFWQGRGGAVVHTISGIDIALWDAFGKACGQPVGRLLGGRYRDRIKPYASILFAEPDILRQRLDAVVERGFRAVKIGWNAFGRVDAATDRLLVRTARETVGDSVEIFVDAGGSEQYWPHGYKWALNTSKMLADFGVGWFEEPLPPDDIDNFRRLRELAPLPIATGEVLVRRREFLPWIETGAADILQPDTTKCGGLSEARRIAWAAADHGVQVVSHGWNTALGLAADLQLASAMPVAKTVEYITPSPYIDELSGGAFRLDSDGLLVIPDVPGIGVEPDPDALARFVPDWQEVD